MLKHNNADNPLLEGLVGKLRCTIMLPSSMEGFFEAEESQSTVTDDKRQFSRWHFHNLGALECLESTQALNRTVGWQRVYTKDISLGGLAFLHSEQLFPMEQMRILLPPKTIEPLFKDRKQQCIIEVTRCHQWGDQCYEVGARFVDEFRDS